MISSSRNPLVHPLSEQTNATYLTTYILNQLFLSVNDVIEFSWIENKSCSIGRTKWDGVLSLVENSNDTLALVEFSGGNKNPSTPKKITIYI